MKILSTSALCFIFFYCIRPIVVQGFFYRYIQGIQYTLENIYDRLVQYSANIVQSTQITFTQLTQESNTNGDWFQTPNQNTNGFQFHTIENTLNLLYQNGIQNSNNIFGTNINYIAVKLNEAVFVGSIFNQTANWTLQPTYYYMNKNDVKQSTFIINNGSKVRVQDKVYDIYAFMICGIVNDVIYIHILEEGSYIAIQKLQYSMKCHHYDILMTNGSYLFLQLGYVTPPTCDHANYIQNLANSFLFTALKDTINSLETVLSTFPSSIDNAINLYVTSPYCYFGGTANSSLQTTVGNSWFKGNFLTNTANSIGLQYTNDQIVNNTQLDFNGTSNTWGRYFTHRTASSCSFTSVLDIAPSSNNANFSVSFSLESTAYTNCKVYNGTFLANNLMYGYIWQVIYSLCQAQQTAPSLNTFIIHSLNEITGDNRTLFSQSYQNSCSLITPFTLVSNPRQRIYYMMYMETCNATYDPINSLSLQIAQSFIQSVDSLTCDYSCNTCSDQTKICLSCNQNNSRILSGASPNTCQCIQGYFENGVSVCAICDYSCQSCTGSSPQQCMNCDNSNNYRALSGPSPNSCLCNQGFFDNGVKLCAICDYSCQSCTGSSPQQCSSCDNSIDYRALSGPTPNSCLCNKGFYENGINICALCHYTCESCILKQTLCKQCASKYNLIMTGPAPNTCQCIEGYFFNNSTTICDKCSYSCQTCDIGGCITCPESQYYPSLPDMNRNCACQLGTFQNKEDKQCQSICGKIYSFIQGDGILLLNEECDDGNTVDRDGCSSRCKIEIGFTFTQLTMSSCFPITISYCIKISNLNNSGIVDYHLYFKPVCQQCSSQYFLSQDNLSCIKCSENCDGCNGQGISQCKKCSKIAIQVTSVQVPGQSMINTTMMQYYCKRCEYFPGLHTVPGVGCKSSCGDGIIRYDKFEQCDDGNQINNDGCSQMCQVEMNFHCSPQQTQIKQQDYQQIQTVGPSICSLKSGPSATLNYAENWENDHLILVFSENISQLNFCNSFLISINSLQQEQYFYNSHNNSLNSCIIQIFFNASLASNQLIILDFNNTLSNFNGRDLVTQTIQIFSKQHTYYSVAQKKQAVAVVQAQSGMTYLILLLGISIIFIGGIEFYWSILDLFTWVNTLYFINVNYPLNIKLFYKYASWTGIFYIPQSIILNKPKDDYYQPGPKKFNDQGFSGCFLASVVNDIQFCLTGLTVCLISQLICSILEKIYLEKKIPKQITIHLFQLNQSLDVVNQAYQEIPSKQIRLNEINLNLPKFFKPIYHQCDSLNKNSTQIFIKLIFLVQLDFQMASTLQLQAGGITRHPFITFNIILAILFQIFNLYLPFYLYSVINKSNILLSHQSYLGKYSSIFEGVLINETQGKFYCIFSIIKKTLFVYFLTYFYQQPILQSVGCSLACCINLILICYKSPFQNKISLIRQLVPEIAIFGSLITSLLFALNDQNQIFSDETRFNLGWLILFFIMSSVLFQCIFLLQNVGLVIKERCQYLLRCLRCLSPK